MHVLMIADPMIPVPPKLYGGIERIIDMLCREYVALGHHVTLVAHPDSRTAGDLIPLPGLRFNSKLDVIRNALAIRSAVKRLRPDVVHSFGRLAQVIPILKMNIPKVMSYQRAPHLPGIAKAHRWAKPGTLTFTGCSEYITRQIATCATAHTIYNGVPAASYTFSESVSHDAPLVFLGRVERIKGVHNAIEIAKATSRKLVIAGNIPNETEHQAFFQSSVATNLDSQIEFIGPVDDTQKNDLLGKALALVMAIEWEEPFGIVMAESLACGTPILGTPRGAVTEVVADGVQGFIRKTNRELAACVGQLPLINRQKCRERFEACFSDQVVVRHYLELYHSFYSTT